jgi:hypothetical protein
MFNLSKPFLLILFFIISHAGAAQISVKDSVNQRRFVLTRTSSLVLSGWGAASLASGLIAKGNTSGTQYYFHRTNAIFGGVNLLLGQIGFWANRKANSSEASVRQAFKSQEKIEKLFLFNTALDLVYVGFGAYLLDKANSKTGADRDRLRGTGQSVILQGGFLLVFDGVLYLLHNKNGNRLDAYLHNLSFGPTGEGFGLVYRF